MNKTGPNPFKIVMRCMSVLVLSLIFIAGRSAGANADEADAKRILKAMSDYMAAQKSISFDFDATLEVVTTDEQKLTLASSGTLTLNRPDKIRVTRSGGFADVELSFDGKTLTLLGKNLSLYADSVSRLGGKGSHVLSNGRIHFIPNIHVDQDIPNKKQNIGS